MIKSASRIFSQFRNALAQWRGKRRLNSSAVVASPDVRLIAGRPEAILFHVGTGRVFRANSLAVRIWHDLVAGKTPAVIVAELSRDYAEQESAIQGDVAAFLRDLTRQRFLTIRRGC